MAYFLVFWYAILLVFKEHKIESGPHEGHVNYAMLLIN